MKKLLTLLVLAGAFTSAQAANWQYFASADNNYTAIDLDSLIFTNNSRVTRSAWIKMHNRNGSYDIVRVFINCPTRMISYGGQGYSYSSNHSLIDQTSGPNSAWEYTAPNSVAEAWSNTICTTNANNR